MGLRRRPKPDLLGSSVIHEPSAREREKQGQQDRRPRRRQRPRRLLAAILIIAPIGAMAVVGAGYAGKGPYASLAAQPQSPDDIKLKPREFQPGDCVIWDESAEGGAMRDSTVVPCTDEHMIEITGRVVLSDLPRDEPTAAEWDTILKERCRASVERHLGGLIDPIGRYNVSGLLPAREAYAMGNRDVWCGIGAHRTVLAPGQPEDDPTMVRFVGRASKETQFLTFSTGACIAPTSYAVVPCSEPHSHEVPGEFDLPDDTQIPATNDSRGWNVLAGDRCQDLADAYVPGGLHDPWRSSLNPISAESWAAGKRTVTCYINFWEAGRFQVVNRSARAVPS